VSSEFRLTPGYGNLTERFVTALEAEPQVYRRILNTICSLGNNTTAKWDANS